MLRCIHELHRAGHFSQENLISEVILPKDPLLWFILLCELAKMIESKKFLLVG